MGEKTEDRKQEAQAAMTAAYGNRHNSLVTAGCISRQEMVLADRPGGKEAADPLPPGCRTHSNAAVDPS